MIPPASLVSPRLVAVPATRFFGFKGVQRRFRFKGYWVKVFGGGGGCKAFGASPGLHGYGWLNGLLGGQDRSVSIEDPVELGSVDACVHLTASRVGNSLFGLSGVLLETGHVRGPNRA